MNYAALIVIVFVGVWYWHVDEQVARRIQTNDIEEAIVWARNCYYDGNTPEECVKLWRNAK